MSNNSGIDFRDINMEIFNNFNNKRCGILNEQDKAKQLENLIRDMLFDIPVIPDRYKYVKRLKEIVDKCT